MIFVVLIALTVYLIILSIVLIIIARWKSE
jgi:hypothetical protein